MAKDVALSSGMCEPWPVDFTACHTLPDALTQAQKDRYALSASEYLWAMTGRRYGKQCPVTVRPCRRSCADGFGLFEGRFLNQGQYRWTGGFIPYMRDGLMYNATLCGCQGPNCHCGPELCEIELPGPVHTITSVDIGGVIQAEPSYRVDDGRFLVRVNDHVAADQCWPSCQDMAKPSGTADTFTVTYSTGLPVPALGVLAVSSLAAHMMADCQGCGSCSPGTRQNLRSLSRQGVDLEFVDPQQIFTDGRTGIEIVDFFIKSVNPQGLASRMRVLSPDAPRRPRLTRG